MSPLVAITSPKIHGWLKIQNDQQQYIVSPCLKDIIRYITQ